MANLSNTFETNFLNYFLRSQTWTQPSACYLALCTSAPSDTALGTEVSGGAYARQSVGVGTGNWSAPADDGAGAMQVTNSNAITFPVATGSWGTVTHGMLMDAVSGGTSSNMYLWFAFDASQSISTNNQVIISAGSLKVKVN